jgi:hypothetical protein
VKYFHVIYDDKTSLTIEGFGQHTLLGAIKDVLEGNYPGSDPRLLGRKRVIRIEISNESSPTV